MIDLHEGILLEFADRQALAPVAASYERAGLSYTRRAVPEYFSGRRALLKERGICSCGAKCEVNPPGVKGQGKIGTRCVSCATTRTKTEGERRQAA